MAQAYQFEARPVPVSQLGVGERAQFITRTYAHLLGAIVAFTLLEVWLFKSGYAESIARTLLGGSWLLVLGAFMLVGWGATHISHSARSAPAQYAALGGFIVAEAIIFVPLLWIAQMTAPGVIQSAALLTLLGFAGLTGTVFITRKDFSFMGGVLRWVGVCALLAIVGGVLFGFQLGTWFSVGMVAFAGAAVLYDTSNVLHHYPVDRHIGAALALFASIAMMFWYILRIFMGNRN